MAAVEESILTNIAEMIDLAIGSPENGVVDFNMLQTVLHCLAQQLRVTDKNVELRGSVASFPVGRAADNAQTLAISEFVFDTGAPGKYELATGSITSEQDTLLVVERKKRSDVPPPVPKVSTPKGRKKSMKSTTDQRAAMVDTAPPQPEPPGPQPAPPPPAQPPPAQPPPAQPPPAQPPPAQPPPAQPPPALPASPPPQSEPPSPQPPTPSPAQPAAAPPPAQPSPSSLAHPPPSSLAQPPPRSSPSPSFSKEKLSLVTLSKFNVLETAVQDLKDRVYGTSPKNEKILQEVRSQTNLKAITEMWSNMNVASRLDAAEEAIGKLSSLIQDLIGETTALQNQITTDAKVPTETRSEAPSSTGVPAPAPSVAAPPKAAPSAAPVVPKSTPSAAPVAPKAAPSAAPVVPKATPSAAPVAPKAAPSVVAPPLIAPSQAAPSMIDLDHLATKDELAQVLSYLESVRDDVDKLAVTFSEALKEVNPDFESPEPPVRMEMSLISTSVAQPPVAQAEPALPPPAAPQGPQAPQVQPAQLARLQDRVAYLENELRKCCDGFRKTEGRIKDQFTSFQDQLEYMSKQISDFTTQGEGGKLSPDLIKDLQGLMKLFETVQSMQSQLKQVHDTALNLAAEKEARQNHIDALLEQIELLKVIKLDREDMVEALADKADLRMLARKVSHDQFENACDDLSKGLEHALGKLNVQESLWQQALDDIQREIEQKLDKIELSPVKDFFNNKLKQLQEHLRQMAALRREAEAAGTKRRLLRDVNCISCDANAVMQMVALPPQPPKPLPAHLSMKPYLSYELDAIRKNQANAIPQRNMHDWETVQQQMQPSKPQRVRSDTDKHLCNRYCGGSHTTTTPAQRVARLGHFIKQWGPEVLPLSSGFAAGDDGRLYKITTSEGANVGPGGALEGAAVCTPKSPAKKPDTSKSQSKAIEIVAECRCLDPTAGQPPPQT